jgi:methyl-accepting chemotaxis protein
LFKNLNIHSTRHKLTLVLIVPMAGMVLAVAAGLQALDSAHSENAVGMRQERDLGAALRAAQAAQAGLATQALLMDAAAPEAGQRPAARQERDAAVADQLAQLAAAMSRLGTPPAAAQDALRRHAELRSQQAGADASDPERGQGQARLGAQYAALAGALGPVSQALDRLGEQRSRELDAAAAARSSRMQAGLAILVALTVALGILVRLSVRRNVVGSMRAAADASVRVAEGDLTVEIEVPADGQAKALLKAMKKMVEDLRSLVGGVATSARTVADTSAQIAQGNIDLSQRTEEQAATLEETASSMEKLSSTLVHTADNAREASQLAVGASEVARRGGQAVGQVVATMTGISEASRKIGDITGVIDGIAFQTNILALNAAVEAARAGEQGRGFAVVAAEVRSLAQRSAAAAREIKSLIGASVDKVEAGTRLVDSAGKTMEEIVAAVKKVSDLIAEIAAAVHEQSVDIGQVNKAVAQMEQVMQQNASLTEEASAATESLKAQAEALLEMVARFKLGGAREASPARLAPIGLRPGPRPAYAALGSYPAAASRRPQWEEV